MSEAIGYSFGLFICLYPIYLFFRMIYRDFKKNKYSHDFKRWEKETLNSLGLFENGKLVEENIKFCGIGTNNYVLYTNDKKLYFFDYNRILTEIKLERIMDIKVDTTVSTKNVKRLVALTSTYDSSSKSYGHLTIITEDKNYVVNYLPDVNEINRFKMILDKHIEELNSLEN